MYRFTISLDIELEAKLTQCLLCNEHTYTHFFLGTLFSLTITSFYVSFCFWLIASNYL